MRDEALHPSSLIPHPSSFIPSVAERGRWQLPAPREPVKMGTLPKNGWVSMPHEHSFDDLMARLRTGDNDAATQVFNRFANRLIELARRQLDPQIRQKLDPEDVLRSVFRSFFAHQTAGQVTGLESWDNL